MSSIARLRQQPNLKTNNPIQEVLVSNRMLFVDTPKGQNMTRKTNHEEAVVSEAIAAHWKEIYVQNDMAYDDSSVGVITPFRSQIAMIKSHLFFENHDYITIDTIERYQGGARDRIIISLTVNDANLLESISNVNDEGLDRKLNVALTRAREHIVILGNKDILQKNPTYARLIAYCTKVSAHQFTAENEQS